MMNEFIRWPKPYFYMLSATCDEILSWIIGIKMKNHLESDNNCNTVNLNPPPFFLILILKKYKE